jgi:hypothetical protein
VVLLLDGNPSIISPNTFFDFMTAMDEYKKRIDEFLTFLQENNVYPIGLA